MLELREPSWRRELADELASPDFLRLGAFVDAERERGEVYPPEELVFSAFERTPFDAVRVVIMGQDPYHEPGQARGLAFHVPPGIPPPPSLRNIVAELRREYPHAPADARADLERWADEGTLLINDVLTVAAGRAASHRRRGWERFTDAAIRALCRGRRDLVFMLWGNAAAGKGAFIDRSRHLVLEAAHPSPLSAHRGFFGCDHFRKADEWLVAHGSTPIAWLA